MNAATYQRLTVKYTYYIVSNKCDNLKDVHCKNIWLSLNNLKTFNAH